MYIGASNLKISGNQNKFLSRRNESKSHRRKAEWYSDIQELFPECQAQFRYIYPNYNNFILDLTTVNTNEWSRRLNYVFIARFICTQLVTEWILRSNAQHSKILLSTITGARTEHWEPLTTHLQNPCAHHTSRTTVHNTPERSQRTPHLQNQSAHHT